MNEHPPYIQTYSGLFFEFLDPKPEQIDIEDIAYSLSYTHRWGAHAWPQISVAQHSLLVSKMLMRKGASPMVQLQGLMHDASETYIGDLPSPVKKYHPSFQAMEALIESAIFAKFGIDYPLDEQVKLFDTEAFRWEYRDRMRDRGVCLPPAGPRAKLPEEDPELVRKEFLWHFECLHRAKEAA